ncbi:hypothetical protein HMPREF0059_01064, partial [Actinomyces viscosus C505]
MTRTGPQGRTKPPQTDPIRALLASPPDLPVVEVLPELRDRLSPSPSASDDAGAGACLVLTAPPAPVRRRSSHRSWPTSLPTSLPTPRGAPRNAGRAASSSPSRGASP